MTIAFASGCSLLASSILAIDTSLCVLIPESGITSVTTGSPAVIVPVLSSAAICIFPVCSSDIAVLNIIPFFAPTPFPTIIATGVASPSAQGQLITSTDIPLASAKPTLCPAISQITIVTNAIAITAGTNTPETLSAIFAIGAFVAAASLTIWIICERVVSSPTLVALHLRYPDVLSVAADIVSPMVLSTGILSPVSADSLTALLPSMISPSTGIFSPGLTTNISPFDTCSTGTCFSSPSIIIVAVVAASFIRLLSASVVFPFECASSILPMVISVRIIAADSK